MINVVKKLYRYLDGQLEDALARRRRRKLDARWMHEFTTLYEYRVGHGLTREEADRAYDSLLYTEVSNILLAEHRAEIEASREEMHWAIDKRIEIDRAHAERQNPEGTA